MNLRKNIFHIALWWSVIGSGIWIGGTLFMMLVIDPQWNSNPPESVKYFFTQTEFNKYIWNFFGPPFMILRVVAPQFISLLLGWKYKMHRRYLLITFSCTVITIIYTLVYIYPINDILMFQAGGNHTPAEIRQMVAAWVLADRVRFAINLVGYFFLLKAFRLPETAETHLNNIP